MSKVPKLRFPEFSGEWEEKKLGEISTSISYGMNLAAKDFDGENIYLRITDIDEDTNNYIKDNKVSPDGDLDDRFLLEEGDVVFARTGASTGKTYYYKDIDGKMYFAGFLIRAKIKKGYDYKYVFYNTLTSRYNNWVKKMSARSGQPGINATEYESYKIYFSSLPEQQKIADFLSTIDSQIETKNEQIENLEGMKKGFMQKIFSQELRFKDEKGCEYPEWEEKKLGEIGEIQSNGVDKKIYENQGEVYLLNYMDVYNKRHITPDNISELMKVTATEQQIVEKNVLKGDIFFTPSSETKEDIGHSMAIKHDLERLVYSYHIVRFRPKSGILDVDFSDYFANNEEVRRQLIFEAQGVQRFTISKSGFENLIVKIPSMKEQQKIANFLSLFDEKIEIEKEILETLKDIKKGLLQQMFV